MIADDLHAHDIESIVINGSIIRREIDQQTQELDAEVVAKIKGAVVIITVYLL